MVDIALLNVGSATVNAQTGFVSLTEAAERKGVHYQTVRRAIRRGDLPATKIGGGVLVTVADLDQWQPKYDHAPRMHRRSQVQDASVANNLIFQVSPGRGHDADSN